MDDRFARVAALIAQQPPAPAAADGVMGTMQRLCGAVAVALSASGAGMSVMAVDGILAVTAASDPASERIEDLQFLLGEGPCIDAYSTHRPVLVPDVTESANSRWPVYASAAYDGGVRAIFAFPLQIGAGHLGVLDVFRARPGPLSTEEIGQALTFTEVAVTTLLDAQEGAHNDTTADGMRVAMSYRAELFQAQGMVMVQLGVSITEALARIRAHAYAENRHLGDVARDVVARVLRFERDHP
jgi:GAF domain-containing protein